MTQQQVLSGRLNALISATGWFVHSSHEEDTTNQERFLHVLYVSQENQNPWIVLRKHSDFATFANSLESINIQHLPTFPKLLSLSSSSSSNNNTSNLANLATSSRNALQEWLDIILQKSISASTSSAMAGPLLQQFLCYGANLYSPEQVEGVHWVTFTNQEFFQVSNNRGNNTSNSSNANRVSGVGSNSARHPSIDEMDMDDMFDTSHYEHQDEDEESTGDDSDDELALKGYSAAARYQPFEEAISKEDAMEIQQQADEAEMVEDVGSLAQSLGASYLGKSLQLQAEMNAMKRKMEGQKEGGESKRQGGLYNAESQKRLLGESTGSSGGIGGAVELADSQTPLRKSKAHAIGDNLYQNQPVATPRLDSFKMIKVIGKGSFGKVTLVKEIKTGEMYALKVLRKDNIIKRNQVEHTRTERSVLGYVKHPFIVGLKYAFQSKDKLYFVLDYCAGGELFFHLGKLGKFPEPRACFYTAEIVLAISYVHNLGIIYRDLKPENVLLDAKGHIRLTDFGLSKEGIVSSSTGAYSFCGTPEYLAPEILNRQGHGRAVDWWSLGALLYEMLSGLPPFYCRDREKLFEKIRKSELTYPRHLSAPAITVLRGLLTRDPKRRLGSGEKDAEEIKCQPFFSDISWTKLANGEIPPPWDPKLNNPLDTSQFDMEFTSMPIFSPATNQHHGGFGATPQENIFEGFTYTDRTFYRP